MLNVATKMIAEIPSSALQIPDYALWMLSGWVLSTLITGWVGYRLGLRSQKEVAKLKSKNEVLAIIERISADMEENGDCWNPHSKIRRELRNVTIQFYSQFAEKDRLRIKKALDNYHALFIGAWQYPHKGTPEREKFDQEYNALLKGLKHLRDEISIT